MNHVLNNVLTQVCLRTTGTGRRCHASSPDKRQVHEWHAHADAECRPAMSVSRDGNERTARRGVPGSPSKGKTVGNPSHEAHKGHDTALRASHRTSAAGLDTKSDVAHGNPSEEALSAERNVGGQRIRTDGITMLSRIHDLADHLRQHVSCGQVFTGVLCGSVSCALAGPRVLRR